MRRLRRLAKPVFLLGAVAVMALVVSGCAFLKPGSLKLSQPQGIGSVGVHFELCTADEEEFCEPNESGGEFQYLAGIAVPPGAVPPQTITATPVNGGTPIVFKLDEEVTSELTASSVSLQKFLGEVPPSEKAEAEKLFGGQWPPSGLQGVGYISQAIQESEGQSREWSVDADFGLPSPAGSPYTGPFEAAIAFGIRLVDPELPESRPVHCLRLEASLSPETSDALCLGSLQKTQVGTDDLRIEAPAKPARAFVGGGAKIGFPLEFAATTATVPTFALSATTTAKGGKTEPGSFTPGSPDPTTHLSPTGTGTVTVSLPKNVKPGAYEVTLTATAPQGGAVSQTGKLKVTMPKLKLGAVKANAAKGTAMLKVTVPSGGQLTIAGKGVARVKKKTGKAKTLKVKIAATGKAAAQLRSAGKAKLKLKATFKPSSGISVSKTKPVVLELR